MNDRTYLTELSPALRPILHDATPNYRKLHSMVLDGLIPMQRDLSRRYYTETDQITVIAETIKTLSRGRRTAAA